MKLLVDTNVFIDYFEKRKPFNDECAAFFQMANELKEQLFATPICIRDFGYHLQNFLHDWKKVREHQVALYEIVSKVLDNSADDAIEGLYSENKDYEDVLMIECAERNGLDAIITNNPKDFKDSKVPVYTTKQFVEYRRNSLETLSN